MSDVRYPVELTQPSEYPPHDPSSSLSWVSDRAIGTVTRCDIWGNSTTLAWDPCPIARLEARDHLYRMAAFDVDTTRLTVDEEVARIVGQMAD